MPILLRPAAWGAHVLMVLAATAAILLGIWQHDVWSGDRTAARTTLIHAPAVPLGRVIGPDSAFPGASIGQPVTFSGRWLPAGTMYVSGKTHAGRRGYWVVTPIVVAGRSAIPVVRGWSGTVGAPAPSGSVSVTGWLEPSEDAGEADTNPRDDVITSMRVASMTQHVDADLYSAYVVARRVTPDHGSLARVGPTRQPDVSGFTGLRNLLYSFQWWIFAAFAVFVWGRWCYDQVRPPAEQAPAADVVSS